MVIKQLTFPVEGVLASVKVTQETCIDSVLQVLQRGAKDEWSQNGLFEGDGYLYCFDCSDITGVCVLN